MHKHQNSDTVHVLTLIVQEVVWDMFCFSAMVTAPKGVSHGQYAGIFRVGCLESLNDARILSRVGVYCFMS